MVAQFFLEESVTSPVVGRIASLVESDRVDFENASEVELEERVPSKVGLQRGVSSLKRRVAKRSPWTRISVDAIFGGISRMAANHPHAFVGALVPRRGGRRREGGR